jgi:hypothetical protein
MKVIADLQLPIADLSVFNRASLEPGAPMTSKKSAIGNRQSAITIQAAYDQLLSWCRQHDFAGHDPFDALNSRIFQSSPLARSRNARLLWTQLLKRSPTDLRSISRTPTERNSKGIALFALAQLANHRRLKTSESEKEARGFLSDLISMRLDGYSGACWGYNFDWQSRHFFAPRGTPTMVPTSFAARALIESAQEFADKEYLTIARSVCNFITSDLPVTASSADQICFGYSPNDDTQIFNASLLGAEVLACVGALTDEAELRDLAQRAAKFVVEHQREDGSWPYGTNSNQAWVDNFHTAFVLFSLKRIIDACGLGGEFQNALERGYEYWKNSFFLADGWPKYYHDDPYPADAHAGASAIVTFLEFSRLDPDSPKLAEQVARWTISNLCDEQGYFYYQKRRFYTVRTPYMRWSQAWMLYALARLLETKE